MLMGWGGWSVYKVQCALTHHSRRNLEFLIDLNMDWGHQADMGKEADPTQKSPGRQEKSSAEGSHNTSYFKGCGACFLEAIAAVWWQ